ncbi:MAG TPA: patatin-like phospholipase family protein [Thermoanaerobaculia bacterium]|nr:patatin-like phospholipase family protein [Thermoanaerobaculia bacterium]
MSVAELAPVPDAAESEAGDLAVMLTGGGARASYQVGLLRGLARHFPHLRFQIITGVSAGAINAIYLAAREGTLPDVVESLTKLWCDLQCHHVFKPNYTALLPFRSVIKSVSPRRIPGGPHGLFNAGPLAHLLRSVFACPMRRMSIGGIQRNLDRGLLHAVALVALDYSTGQSVRWVQGRHAIEPFERPNRRSEFVELTIEHVLASAALPFVFPAVRIGERFYGDGGIRLSAPLAPAVHLGARRILAMSTGYQRTAVEASQPEVRGYPPAAQVIGQLVNAIFLDVIDEDVVRMERMNEILRQLPEESRDGMKPIDLFVLRPSHDLGKLAADYQRYLPMSVKLFTRALGADETESSDLVSMLMFEPNFTRMLIEIGEHDVEGRLDELASFLGENVRPAAARQVRR